MSTIEPGSEATPNRRAAGVALVALVAFVALLALPLLSGPGLRPEVFARFGDESSKTTGALDVLGPDMVIQRGQGHDGALFWAIAHDPLIIDPAWFLDHVDQPGARSARVLYPLLASPWALGGETALLWGLVITNLAVVGLGTFVTARLAMDLGASASLGFAFAFNPVVLLATLMDLSDALLCLLVVTFVWAVHRQRLGWALVAAVLGALAKESSLVAVIGVALLAPSLPRRFRIAAALGPGAAFVAWSAYSRGRLGWAADRIENFDLVPFRGLVDAVRYGWVPDGRWAEAAVGGAVVALGIAILVRWFRRRNLLMAAAGAPVLVLPFYASVAYNAFVDSSRAIGASLTLLVLDIAVERARRGLAHDDGARWSEPVDRPLPSVPN